MHFSVGQAITVEKRDHVGASILEYPGTVLDAGPTWVCVDTVFGRDLADIGLMRFVRGDRMIEWFYSDRYYNVFEVYEGRSGRLKGWYCNVVRPAVFAPGRVAADDLALDLHVSSAGITTLLDQDEFEALRPALPAADVASAWDAVATLEAIVRDRSGPFEAITGGRRAE